MSKPKKKRELLTGDEANFRALLRLYKKNARKRKHVFEISEERFRELTKGNCYICGRQPSTDYRDNLKERSYRIPYKFNGIDRFDNSIGYVDSNVISCCGHCNRAKGKLSIEQFLIYLYEAYKHCLAPAIAEGVPHVDDEDPHEG